MKIENKRRIGDMVYLFAWIILAMSLCGGFQQLDSKNLLYCSSWILFTTAVTAAITIIYLLNEDGWNNRVRKILVDYDHLFMILGFVTFLVIGIVIFPTKTESSIVMSRINDQYVSVRRYDGKIVSGEDTTNRLKPGDKVYLKGETLGEGFGDFAIKQ